MMLRTSLNSINPTFKMLGLTLRKNIGLIILTIAVALLICPGYMAISFTNIMYDSDIILEIGNWVEGITIFASILGLIGTFAYNIINLSYMFSKSSSDVFHSMPLTRGELLLSRAVSGLISTLIPLTVLFTSLVCMSAIYGCLCLYIGKILLCFALAIASTLVFWSMSIMLSVCAGAVFDYILSYVGANLGVFVIAVIFYQLLDGYLIGYTDNFPVYKFFSPVFYCINTISEFLYDYLETKSIILFFVIAVLLTAVFSTVTFLLYKKRKAEKAGSAYAYRFIYIICGFIASFCGAYGVGVIFSLGDINTITYWIFAPIGAILTAIAYGAVTNRGFKKFKRSVLLGIVSVAIMGVITVLMFLDPIGFSKRVPNENNIIYVEMEIDNFDEVTYTDNNLPFKLHKRIVNENLAKREKDYYREYASVYLGYTLKNGKSIKRSFTVLKEDIKEEYLNYHVGNERFNMFYENLAAADPMSANFYYNDGIEYYDGQITANQLKELFEIYRAEVKTAGNVLENKDMDKDTQSFSASWQQEGNYNYYHTGQIYFNDKCVNTKAFIASLVSNFNSDELKD